MSKVELASIVELDKFKDPVFRESLGRIVCTSLGADPIHAGHISCLQESTAFGDTLVAVVNGDWFLKQKKGRAFMSLKLRCEVVSAIKGVDLVVPFEIENDPTVCKALEIVRPHVFTKGGDRKDKDTIPEWDTCKKLSIELLTDIGDPKEHSSSEMLEDWYRDRVNLFFTSQAS